MNNVRDNLPFLYDFYVVAKEGGITSAADKLMITLSNLSKRLTTLEDNLNLKLLNRSNKGIELTSDGERLFKDLEVRFGGFTLSIEDNDISGEIVIGTTRNISDYRLSECLVKYNEIYPNVEISLLIDNATNLNSYLTDHRIDVLIDYLPQINFTEKYDFETKAFGEFKTCFACNKEFYDKYGKNIKSLSDLNNYKLIIPGKSRRRQMLDEVLQSKDIVLRPIMKMPDSKNMIDIVSKSDYIGYFIEDELENTNLVKLELEEEMPTNSFGLVYLKHTINPLAKKFVELISKY